MSNKLIVDAGGEVDISSISDEINSLRNELSLIRVSIDNVGETLQRTTKMLTESVSQCKTDTSVCLGKLDLYAKNEEGWQKFVQGITAQVNQINSVVAGLKGNKPLLEYKTELRNDIVKELNNELQSAKMQRKKQFDEFCEFMKKKSDKDAKETVDVIKEYVDEQTKKVNNTIEMYNNGIEMFNNGIGTFNLSMENILSYFINVSVPISDMLKYLFDEHKYSFEQIDLWNKFVDGIKGNYKEFCKFNNTHKDYVEKYMKLNLVKLIEAEQCQKN